MTATPTPAEVRYFRSIEIHKAIVAAHPGIHQGGAEFRALYLAAIDAEFGPIPGAKSFELRAGRITAV